MRSVKPDLRHFQQSYEAGRPQAVYTRRIADLETPVSAYLKIARSNPNTFLLESVQGGENRGRYSVIGVDPDVIWRCRSGKAEVNRQANVLPDAFQQEKDEPLVSLRRLVRANRMVLPDDLPPMASGLFGYLGYDMVRLMEHLAAPLTDPLGLPDGLLLRPTVIAIFDNIRDEITLVTTVWPEPGVDTEVAYRESNMRLERALRDLEGPIAAESRNELEISASSELTSNTTQAEYLGIVERAKEYIRAGDIFQVVPSQRFSRAFSLAPFSLYRALRRLNPSPFLYHLAFPGFALVGSSPEILVQLRDGIITIRPIAGTRARGKSSKEDAALAEQLMSDPKERAEHLMLLDLGRNDVGRVAEIGTVHVTDSFFIERYSHVMHLVSNVEGRLNSELDAIDALAAGFPAGTLSGAPKFRAMQIIDELEREKRGAGYGGAIGYFSANGSMDTCIVLRTAVLKDGIMHVQAGGGVVADSDPAAEYQESINKAKALFAAADEAFRLVQEDHT